MILFASQPDCYIACTHKVTGDIVRDLFLGEDTDGIWRIGDEVDVQRVWPVAEGVTFASRDAAFKWLDNKGWHVEIIR